MFTVLYDICDPQNKTWSLVTTKSQANGGLKIEAFHSYMMTMKTTVNYVIHSRDYVI